MVRHLPVAALLVGVFIRQRKFETYLRTCGEYALDVLFIFAAT
ncbi:MAG: hypothetical protein ACTHLE_13085 [Agriterribacter sp.]